MPSFRWSSTARNSRLFQQLNSQGLFWCYHNLVCYASEQGWQIDTTDLEYLAIEVADGDVAMLERTLSQGLRLKLLSQLDDTTILCAAAQGEQYDYASDTPEAARERKRRERQGALVRLVPIAQEAEVDLSAVNSSPVTNVTRSHESVSRDIRDRETAPAYGGGGGGGEVSTTGPTTVGGRTRTPTGRPSRTTLPPPKAAGGGGGGGGGAMVNHHQGITLTAYQRQAWEGLDTIFGALTGRIDTPATRIMRAEQCRRMEQLGITADDVSDFIRRTGYIVPGNGFGESGAINALVAERNKQRTAKKTVLEDVQQLAALQAKLRGNTS